VYLALADLTVGYGKRSDVVSLAQIAEHAGGMRRQHVLRALKRLATLGLYAQAAAGGWKVARWVIWPPPPVAEAGYSPQGVAQAGTRSVAEAGTRSVARRGTHQEVKEGKTTTVVVEESSSTGNGELVARNHAILLRVGIRPERAAAALAAAPGLTPMGLAVLAAGAPGDVRNLPGWLRARLEGGDFSDVRLTPQLLCKAANHGIIVAIGGHRLGNGTAVQWNAEALMFQRDDRVVAQIPAKALPSVQVR
jgi:hypothetical protein